MWLGVDYYPEQWDCELWEQDLENICELGCNVIRIGEFAWHIMEKKEGEYDFSFFDCVIAKAKEKGLKVIMGTPTATIPAWLAKKEPSILSEYENGTKRAFGGRHVSCYNSPVLYKYAEKIIRRQISHFKEEKTIIAWQIDNELGHEESDVCYCRECQRKFQQYLCDKFQGNIEKLNETYGTIFWSQEYNDFDEIPTPTATIAAHNPALRLDWERFRSESIVTFAKFQKELIKEIQPDAVVIHDFSGGGLEKHVDYAKVSEILDVAAYNNYPVWGEQREPLRPHEIAFGLDYMRGLKQKNFWITEAIMGAQGHDVSGYAPRPNQAKMWSYQGFAHGCDSMLYFRYRGAVKGAEQFCYGILDADNVKRRKFYEVKEFFHTIRQYKAAMETPIKSQVAIGYDYDSLAAFRIQKQSFLLECSKEMQKFYKPFYDKNVSVDILPAGTDISSYKVIILPQMLITKKEFSEKIKEFVKAGGTLVLTYRSGVKDVHNNLVFGEVIPVGYSSFAGVSVVETESLQKGQQFPLKGTSALEGDLTKGGIFRDMLEVSDAEVLYYYGDRFYQEYAAVTRKKQGKGWVYYLGCGLEEETLQTLLNMIMEENRIVTEESEEGVEVVYRGCGKNKVRMVMNHNGFEVKDGERILAPYESVIQKIEEA